MKKFFKWLLIIIGAIIVISIFSGRGKENKSSQQEKISATPTQTQEAMKITARQLADDFDSNQISAETNWGDKLVELSAEITNINDAGVYFANVASKDFSMAQILCKVKNKEQLMSIKNGETITVRGIVGKQTLGVIDLNNCEIIN